eukprot:scaffold131443_cov18-Tisochrysis_lutea.AAC.1
MDLLLAGVDQSQANQPKSLKVSLSQCNLSCSVIARKWQLSWILSMHVHLVTVPEAQPGDSHKGCHQWRAYPVIAGAEMFLKQISYREGHGNGGKMNN